MGANLGNTETILTNCSNSGSITNSSNAGGLVGYNGGTLTIENSHNTGTVTNSLGVYAGGLLGRDNAATNVTTIINSYNFGTIITNSDEERGLYIGGLAGSIKGIININNSYNTGNINNNRTSYTSTTNKYLHLGGIVGGLGVYNDATYDETRIIANSYNTGNIFGGTRTGGIIGVVSGLKDGKLIINNCYNKGTITSNIQVNNARPDLGGIIGTAQGNTYIINSHNEGNVSATHESFNTSRPIAGGLIGAPGGNPVSDILTLNVVNSYNNGTVLSNIGNASGIVGAFSNNLYSININNAFSNGQITAYSTTYQMGIGYISSAKSYALSPSYYLDTASNGGSNVDGTTSRTATQINSQEFVNTLNSNRNSINLSNIDSDLSGYTLKSWKLGPNGYPIFDD